MNETQELTWTQLMRLEPRLGQLHLDCRFADHKDPNGFDADLAWNGSAALPGLKHRLALLVGINAEGQDSRLRSSQAYDLASAECYQALPPNRDAV
ncbi:MAG TPA: hypothetical protein VMT46_17170 [Anaerolineaceae bacterium]|nr:hypothetical protein [Anaerolineaceae bacterium]